MNPDKEDPNNHVPAVSPDDDWDGLDVDQVFDSQLPPRRSETPRIPKMDVNLSVFKTIHPDQYVGEAASLQDDTDFKSLVSLDINAERSVVEKEDFQAARVMESLQQTDASTRGNEKYLLQGRMIHEERNDWGENPKKGSTRWMLYTAVGVIGLIALTVFLSHFIGKKPDRKLNNNGQARLAPIDPKDEPIKNLGALEDLVNSNREAIRIYGRYAQAKSENDFLKSVYLSERNASLVTDGWKSIGAESGWMPSDKTSWKAHKDGELLYAELRGVNHDFSKFLAFFRYENSDLKMDWKATTGYGTAEFDKLKIGEGDGSEVRGWISPSDFFTQQLSDDRYHSFIFRSPSKEASIWVYTEIGTQVDQDIMALFSISPITGEYQTEVGVILNVERGNQDILPRQWMIKNLKAANWLDQAAP